MINLLITAGCATFYQRNAKFQAFVSDGKMEKAEDYLKGSKKMQRDRNRLLYLFNMGFVNHLQQDFQESNKYFNEADLLIEDYKRNYGSEALALISNPEVKPYKAEDFESVLLHYYKALNYLNLGQFDGAAVEARRINLKLQELNDKYKDHKNRYQADAFAHIVMGLAYEAQGEINDAFIAYRNAYNVYTGEHGYFGVDVPKQLKEDILRTAAILGFGNELDFYQKEFNMTYTPAPNKHGELIFFWHNGMGPVKDEWSVNFFAVPGQGGYINFTNEELGVTFPFYVGDDKKKRNDLLALKVVRVAFPKYLERPTYYKKAWLDLNGDRQRLELAEDVNAIAFKTLEDRFVREMASALLRLATKKLAEVQISQENEMLGALATVTNAVTEKADTRNWQTLPHSIYYTRTPLEEGQNKVVLKTEKANGTTDATSFEFTGRKGRMVFFPYHSLEHKPAAGWDATANR